MSVFRIITSIEELMAATQDKTARYLILRNDLVDVPCFSLMPFQSLAGEFDGRTIKFLPNADGIKLTKGNELKNLHIKTDPDRCAIFQDQEVESMGVHHLSRLSIVGMVRFVIEQNIKKGRIEASFIHIESASTLELSDRPSKYGVELVMGAFTIWNKSDNLDCLIEADVSHFSCGGEATPIHGSGLVIAATDIKSGCIRCNVVSSGHVYVAGEIGDGIPNLLTAAIAIGDAVVIKHLTNYGRSNANGSNALGVLNWGTVEKWYVTDCIITHGKNGSAFVNAGNIGKISFSHSIETFGVGARGFYMFDGTVKDVHFDKITTHGDGACGIQFDRFIENMTISNGIETFGNAIGVKFADTVLKAPADGICVKTGGAIRMLKVSGDIVTHGTQVHSIFIQSSIERMFLSGKVAAFGDKSVALEVLDGYFGGENITFISQQWVAILLENAKINNCHELIAKGKDIDLLIDINSSVDRNVIAPENIKGIFQPDVRIEYTDNVDLTYREGLKPKKIDTTPVDVTKELGEGHSGGPMACKAPTDVKPEKEPEN